MSIFAVIMFAILAWPIYKVSPTVLSNQYVVPGSWLTTIRLAQPDGWLIIMKPTVTVPCLYPYHAISTHFLTLIL